MKRVLVVFAHPKRDSFNFFILKEIEKILYEKNVDYFVRDLYELNFDPVFRFEIDSIDVLEEQDHIRKSDLIIFIYPIWWGSMPAILKGYIDRVFSYGFAYSINENQESVPLLNGKKSVIISTFGGEEKIYKQLSLEQAIKKINQHVIFEFCGIDVCDQFFIYNVKDKNKEELQKKMDELKNKIEKILNDISELEIR
ncbi:MAG: NAD(P)H-dependent oxidoreductase [Candidatus Calescibacterium sp.]|nr:NAD(P)H-dependent oxidoreductase [Candidatus Calescibacterium sp.]